MTKTSDKPAPKGGKNKKRYSSHRRWRGVADRRRRGRRFVLLLGTAVPVMADTISHTIRMALDDAQLIGGGGG